MRPFAELLASVLLLQTAAFPGSGITGVFDAGWSTWYRSRDSLSHLHRRLHAMGATEIVLQYALVEGDHRYYPSKLDFAQDEPDHSALLANTFEAASAAGNRVWIGLYYDDSDWWTPPTAVRLDTLAHRTLSVAQELASLHGKDAALRGFYIPQEIARWYWRTDSLAGVVGHHFLRPVTDSLHAMGFSVMAAPFFNASLETPEQLGAFLDTLFRDWHPDILAVQDGIGVDHVDFARLGGYLRAVQQACARHGVAHWVDVELFAGNRLAPRERVRAQVDSAWASGATGVLGYDLSVLGDGGLDSLSSWLPRSSRIAPRVAPGTRSSGPLRDITGRKTSPGPHRIAPRLTRDGKPSLGSSARDAAR